MKVVQDDKSILKIEVGNNYLMIHKANGYFLVGDSKKVDSSVIVAPEEFPSFLSAMRFCMNSHKGGNAAEKRKVQNTEKE